MEYFRRHTATMARYLIFGSGKGSNAKNLLTTFKGRNDIQFPALVSDKPRRGFLDISYEFRVNLEMIKGPELEDSKWINHLKLMYRPDYILLLGFLQKVPETFLNAFPDRVINLHPSLLPAFGGKGMFGSRVHDAVIAAGMEQSGISLHLANNEYDQGAIIRQYSLTIAKGESAQELATRIAALEHEKLPEFIEYLNSL